jgi:hypothetical protein
VRLRGISGTHSRIQSVYGSRSLDQCHAAIGSLRKASRPEEVEDGRKLKLASLGLFVNFKREKDIGLCTGN